MIDKNVDTPPTVENLYKEGYLTEHVKTAKDICIYICSYINSYTVVIFTLIYVQLILWKDKV